MAMGKLTLRKRGTLAMWANVPRLNVRIFDSY